MNFAKNSTVDVLQGSEYDSSSILKSDRVMLDTCSLTRNIFGFIKISAINWPLQAFPHEKIPNFTTAEKNTYFQNNGK